MCLFIGHGSCKVWPEGPLKLLSRKKKRRWEGGGRVLAYYEWSCDDQGKGGLYSHPLSMGLVPRGALQCQPTNQVPWNRYEFFLLGLSDESHHMCHFPGPKWIDWYCSCLYGKKKKRIESSRNKASGEIPKGLILWMKHLGFFCMVFLQNVLGELWGRGFKLRTKGQSSSSHFPSPSLCWYYKTCFLSWD